MTKEEGIDDPIEEGDEEDDAERIEEVEIRDGDFGGREEGLKGEVHLAALVLGGGAHLFVLDWDCGLCVGGGERS